MENTVNQKWQDPWIIGLAALAVVGWIAFFIMWIGSSSQAQQAEADRMALMAERTGFEEQLTQLQSTGGELSAVTDQLNAARSELDQVTTQQQAARQELDAATANLKTATDNQAAREAAVAEAEARIAELERSRTETETAMQTTQTSVDTLNQQVTEIGQRLEAARNDEATSRQTVAQLTEEAATTTKQLADLQTQIETARQQQSEAQAGFDQLTAETENANAGLEQLRTETADLETRRGQLNTDIEGYTSQRDALQQQVTELTESVRQRGEELSTIEAQITAATAQRDAAPVASGLSGSFAGAPAGTQGSIALTLGADGRFTMRDARGRSVNGAYTAQNGNLVFSDVTGSIGSASFPMTCPVTEDGSGFTVGTANGCVLAGARFERTP